MGGMTNQQAYNAGLRDYGRRESLHELLTHISPELAMAYKRGWSIKADAGTKIKEDPPQYPGKNRLPRRYTHDLDS